MSPEEELGNSIRGADRRLGQLVPLQVAPERERLRLDTDRSSQGDEHHSDTCILRPELHCADQGLHKFPVGVLGECERNH